MKEKFAIYKGLVKYLILLIILLFCIMPFIFMLLSSLRPGAQMVQNGLTLDFNPKTMSLHNFKALFGYNHGMFFLWFKNSIVLTALQTALSLLFCAMVGYGLGVYNFRGRNIIFLIVLAVMMIPTEVLILPLFKLVVKIRLINTKAGVILPFVVSSFAVFYFRQYCLGLPLELIDSARIDGCNEISIFFRIMSPVMLPAYAAIMILQAMNSWNGFVWPLIALRSNENMTLPIGLNALLTPYGNNYDVLLAGAVFSVIPIIILFLVNQKAFITGLTVGSIKG
ncbi:carbohydrate ABC transporter permease [Treponema sp. C6A8]|uniref:carbohydrate ABC transporter permease n=1 Tax=Treponema sp. C6A8 TaxID=1410609 RepID=UPI0004849039|nr:carbohydrate ABC transporter permease [Treponema sp. C6A8]